MNKVWILGLALVVLMTSGCVFGNKKKEAEKEQIRLKMEAYLEESHGRDFTVDKPKKIGNAGMGYNSWAAYAHTVEAEPITFGVEWIIGEPGEFSDNYVRRYWSRDGLREFKSDIEEAVGTDMVVNFDCFVYGPLYNKIYEEIKPLNYQEVMNTYQEDVILTVNIYTFRTQDIDKETEAENIYALYSEIKKKYPSIDLCPGVTYIDPTFREKFMSVFESKKWHVLDWDKLHKDGIVYNKVGVTPTDMPAVNVEEILKRFYY